jgi:hypothetical protein
MEMTMTLAFKTISVLEQEYATKGELHYGLRISYERIAKAIREGKLAVHLIDGKVQIEVKEAIEVLLTPRQRDLFA